MSNKALTWAFDQDVRPSSVKFVLVAMADLANESGESYPSAEHLTRATSQDRKTVLAAIARLTESGHLTDTGKRTGRTGQVRVFRLNLNGAEKQPESGTVSAEQEPESYKQPENGMLSNDTESGTVKTANHPETGTVEQGKRYRFSAKGSQKRDTEPSVTKKKKESEHALAFPEGFEPELWAHFRATRKAVKKPMTDHAEQLLLAKLTKLAAQGYNPTAIVERSIENGWSGLFEREEDLSAAPAGGFGNGSTGAAVTTATGEAYAKSKRVSTGRGQSAADRVRAANPTGAAARAGRTVDA